MESLEKVYIALERLFTFCHDTTPNLNVNSNFTYQFQVLPQILNGI